MPKELEKTAEEIDQEASGEELEKALDTAIEKLSKADKGKKFADRMAAAKKAKKGGKEEDEEEDEDEEEPDEDEDDEEYSKSEEPDFENLSKSLDESLSEDPNSAEVLEVTPFLKSLVAKLDGQITDLTKAIVYQSERIERMEKSQNRNQGMEIAQAKLIKSISTRIEDIGKQPLPRKSSLGQNLQIMRKSGEDGEMKKSEISVSQALSKLPRLVQEGKLGLQDSIKIESRLQKGMPLSDDIMEKLV